VEWYLEEHRREKPWQSVWVAAGVGRLIACLWKHEPIHEPAWAEEVEGSASPVSIAGMFQRLRGAIEQPVLLRYYYLC
jgi:hypothetical protein